MLFWVLIIIGRDELGLNGIFIAVSIWAALLPGLLALGVTPYLFVAAPALVDVVLLLMVFGADIKVK